MHAVFLTLFVSGCLAAMGVGLFAWTHRERTREHIDRLALLPLVDDTAPSSPIVSEGRQQ